MRTLTQVKRKLIANNLELRMLLKKAASKNNLFWTPRGQLLRYQRIIQVINIPRVARICVPLKDDVVKPRALITLIDGLAELQESISV